MLNETRLKGQQVKQSACSSDYIDVVQLCAKALESEGSARLSSLGTISVGALRVPCPAGGICYA